jgi:hypothetical protein
MQPLKDTPFLSLRNVPLWMGGVLIAVIVGLVAWPR